MPQIHVLNKCEVAGLPPGIERDEYGKIRTIRLSALTGAGCDAVHQLFAETFPLTASESFAPDESTITQTN